ncbi:MOSC domain-containing protein [Sulfurimonas sp.]|jgi:MOSC domain-containing protein YiiM|uniref:MOSC domain-containing protein n=1 Tax=Sulfurimonas sp. TaxID=2022749 RepID=UPI002A3657E5|nr:MOSC domain-containing protein [Sulfurimonas sp.]MDY0122571.1 MOSC domain-containing protein [Sulfurimonas sp.]
MSKKRVGKIIELFISTKESSTRVNKPLLELELAGAVGDKFYDKDNSRSILITSEDSYNLIKEYDIEMPYGYLGENILMDYNPYALSMGSRFQIGTALLEISQNCTICNHLSTLDKRIPKLLKNDRGIFAKVVKPGKISKGDDIYMLEE